MNDHARLLALEPEDLDGHTVDELADYVEAGMRPADPTIDDSAACRNAIAAIVRLRAASQDALELAALDEPAPREPWIADVMSAIALESRAGRDIPLRPARPSEHAVLTEGAVRSLVRRAGDEVDGVIVGRCVLDGDVTELGAPVRVLVSVSVMWGHAVAEVADRVRRAVNHVLLEQTELVVTAVDVEVRDVLLQRAEPPEVES